MTFSLSDLLGVGEPSGDIVSSDGTLNFQNAQDWISDNINATQELFGNGAGLHIGYAHSFLGGYSPALGLGVGAGGEFTIGVGGNVSNSFFGTPQLNFGVTVANAFVGGFDWTAGSAGGDFSNQRIVEPAIFFGGVQDLEGVAVGVEFTFTVNGITGGFGAVVPAEDVDDVIAAINDQISGRNFSTTGSGRQVIADILSDIFPPGSMLIGLAGVTKPKSAGLALDLELILTGVGLDQDAALQALRDQLLGREYCFLEDTSIRMWPLDPAVKADADGRYDEEFVLSKVWHKPIGEVQVGDVVLAYDTQGRLQPGRVERTMQNHSRHVLDFWGTGITPGHACYCADGPLKGKHAPIMDILRSDTAMMRADSTMFRSTTNCEIGSIGDRMIHAEAAVQKTDGSWTPKNRGQIRFGTRISTPDGKKSISVMEIAERQGWSLSDDGYMVGKIEGADGTVQESKFPFPYTHGADLPKPEDYILTRSQVTLEEIYLANEWEQISTRMPAPDSLAGFNPNSTMKRTKVKPNIPPAFANRPDAPTAKNRAQRAAHALASPSAPSINRKQRNAMEAKQRKATKKKVTL